METFYAVSPYVLGFLLVATLGVLIVGVVAMGSKNVSPATRNNILRIRVGLHALAVLILLALMASTLWQNGN